MPIIAVQVRTLKTPQAQQKNFRATLLSAGIPEYSYQGKRAGFEVWHAEVHEGETKIIWHTFSGDDVAEDEAREGLKECAAVLQENYWVQLYTPSKRSLRSGRMHLRVLHGLNWLS